MENHWEDGENYLVSPLSGQFSIPAASGESNEMFNYRSTFFAGFYHPI